MPYTTDNRLMITCRDGSVRAYSVLSVSPTCTTVCNPDGEVTEVWSRHVCEAIYAGKIAVA